MEATHPSQSNPQLFNKVRVKELLQRARLGLQMLLQSAHQVILSIHFVALDGQTSLPSQPQPISTQSQSSILLSQPKQQLEAAKSNFFEQYQHVLKIHQQIVEVHRAFQAQVNRTRTLVFV